MQTNITCSFSLVFTQTGDTSGASSLTIQNKGGLHGIQVATSDPTLHVTDLVFATGAAVLRDIRFDGRVSNARCGVPSLRIGGAVAESPCLAVRDTYSAITKLAVGSYTSPGANALSITGNTAITGSLSSSS